MRRVTVIANLEPANVPDRGRSLLSTGEETFSAVVDHAHSASQ